MLLYGQHLYDSGRSLQEFRQLLVHCQHVVWGHELLFCLHGICLAGRAQLWCASWAAAGSARFSGRDVPSFSPLRISCSMTVATMSCSGNRRHGVEELGCSMWPSTSSPSSLPLLTKFGARCAHRCLVSWKPQRLQAPMG